MKGIEIEDIIDIFGEIIDVSGAEIDENTLLGDDIPVDSSDMLRVISRIESKYCFKFKPEDILGFETVGDIIKVIRKYLNTRC
jgi:acyl carrier protein